MGVGEVFTPRMGRAPDKFQSRCRDLGVGEGKQNPAHGAAVMFQSRCRDLGVGEVGLVDDTDLLKVSVSLPRFGGWRGEPL